MKTPQENEDGYEGTAISNATALAQNKRFLIMHGTGDDNVHYQNTLTLLDKLDLASVKNYDMHVFPDSDHSIYYHNANKIVYESKSQPKTVCLFKKGDMLTEVQNSRTGSSMPSMASGSRSMIPCPSRRDRLVVLDMPVRRGCDGLLWEAGYTSGIGMAFGDFFAT